MVEKKLLVCVAALATMGSAQGWTGLESKQGGDLTLKKMQGVSNLDDPMILGLLSSMKQKQKRIPRHILATMRCRGGAMSSAASSEAEGEEEEVEKPTKKAAAPKKSKKAHAAEEEQDEEEWHDASATAADEKEVEAAMQAAIQAEEDELAAERSMRGAAGAAMAGASLSAEDQVEEEEVVDEEGAPVANGLRGRRRDKNGKVEKKKDRYNAKMQWMITNRMRTILIDELHYEPEEVEAMMPDVAAVVINKHLERPRNGMPAEWRKDFHLRQRGIAKIKSMARQMWRKVTTEPGSLVKYVLSAAVIGGIIKAIKGRFQEEEEEWVEVEWYEDLYDRVIEKLPPRLVPDRFKTDHRYM